FPTTPGAFDETPNGDYAAGNDDAFVTKVNAAGTAFSYSTLLGGSSVDSGNAVAVDASGNAHVVGITVNSGPGSGVPTTPGAFDTTLEGPTDGFVTKLNPAGSALVYSTFLGGTSFDNAKAIAVDGSGAYVTGETDGTFPTTPGAFDTDFNGGGSDAFSTKFDTAGALADSTFLGGGSQDIGHGIAVDGGG